MMMVNVVSCRLLPHSPFSKGRRKFCLRYRSLLSRHLSVPSRFLFHVRLGSLLRLLGIFIQDFWCESVKLLFCFFSHVLLHIRRLFTLFCFLRFSRRLSRRFRLFSSCCFFQLGRFLDES